MRGRKLIIFLLGSFVVAGDGFGTRIGSFCSSQLSASRLEEATTATASAAKSISSWENLQGLLQEQQASSPLQQQQPPPLVTLFRDTNGWCPFCERVWLTLEIKQIPYQEQLINLQNKPAWFKQIVPTALVPAVLLHSEQLPSTNLPNPSGNDQQPERALIWESLEILKALDERFPDTPRLILDDQDDYLRAQEIVRAASTAGVQFLYGGRNATVTEEERAIKKQAFVQTLKTWDEFLGNNNNNRRGPFCLGQTITGVDIEIIPTMERWRHQLAITANLTLYDPNEFPNIVQWFDALDQYEPYTRRVAGDAYSWTAVASTFLRYFSSENASTMSAQTQQAIHRADMTAHLFTSTFNTCNVYEETDAAKQQAAAKLISNHQAIVADCTNADPQSQKELPRATDPIAADSILRAVTLAILTDTETILVDTAVNAQQAALAANTIAARLCVPRDMGAPAAQVLRKTLWRAAAAFLEQQKVFSSI